MITGIKVSNFKSILDLPLLSLGEINFIIGANGAGKSNLISVIEFTRRLCSGTNIEEALSSIAPFGLELFTRGSNNPSASFTLCLKDSDGQRYELAYTISITDRELTVTNEKLAKYEGQELKDIYLRKLNSFTARMTGSTNGTLEKVPFSVKGNELAIASYDDPDVAIASKIIGNVKVLWFDRNPDSYFFGVHRKDSLNKSNLDGLVVSLHENKRDAFDKAVQIIKQIIPEFTSPSVTKLSLPSAQDGSDSQETAKLDSDRYVVYWNEREASERAYTLSGLSDGNFRVIQLIFALFDAAEGSSCLIGEELENGQHYGRIKTLMEVLKHLAIKLNIQLIFTTHNAELLNNVSPSDVIYCSKDSDGYSSYKRLSDIVSQQMVAQELGREPTTRELIDFGMI